MGMSDPLQCLHFRYQCGDSCPFPDALAFRINSCHFHRLKVCVPISWSSYLEPYQFRGGGNAHDRLRQHGHSEHSVGSNMWAMLAIWLVGVLTIIKVRKFHICAVYVISFLFFAWIRSLMGEGVFLAEIAPLTGP